MIGSAMTPGAKASGVHRIVHWIDEAIRWSATVVLVATTIALFFVIGSEVLIRYGTQRSSLSLTELPALLFPWMAASGIVLAAQFGQHFLVEFGIHLMGPRLARFVFAATQVINAATFFYLGWTGLEILEVTAGESLPMTGIPSSWSYLGVVIGFVLLGITCLTTLHAAITASGDPLKVRAVPDEIMEGGAA
ncbi:MAG TPA: TRAP transporter small permease subunit [Actinomycetota bacterium]|nr:TRAP transporter small permease subunit [Actinomycetota bacterium]